MTLDQKWASLCISYAMAMIHDLKAKTKEKTARWNRLRATEDSLGMTLDFYRLEKFSRYHLDCASRLFDAIKVQLEVMMPTEARKRQNRRLLRCNQTRIERPVRRVHK